MTRADRVMGVALAASLALCGPGFAAQPTPADAPAVLSSDAIEAALRKPAAETPAAAEPVRTRGLRLQAREEESRAGDSSGGSPSVAGAGAVNLQIAFELDSAALQPAARRQLGELAKALQSPALRGHAFVIAGHTDASGRPEHNRQLSLARANSVREYLAIAGVETKSLSVAGYGADRPLPDRSPYDAMNRRVEVRTLESDP